MERRKYDRVAFFPFKTKQKRQDRFSELFEFLVLSQPLITKKTIVARWKLMEINPIYQRLGVWFVETISLCIVYLDARLQLAFQ